MVCVLWQQTASGTSSFVVQGKMERGYLPMDSCAVDLLFGDWCIAPSNKWFLQHFLDYLQMLRNQQSYTVLTDSLAYRQPCSLCCAMMQSPTATVIIDDYHIIDIISKKQISRYDLLGILRKHRLFWIDGSKLLTS